MTGYQKLKKEIDELKSLLNEIDNHLWNATKTATGETREHIQKALRMIHMYEKK